MLELSARCGFICTAFTEYTTELANGMASRLLHRSGSNVYQSVNFSIALFGRDAALRIFGETGLLERSDNLVHWKITTVDDCALVMEALMPHASTSNSQGMARALISESETTASVIALMMPTLEAKWMTMAKGGSCLRVNFMYAAP